MLIGLSIPVGAALGVLGLILDPLFSMLPLSRAIGEISWSSNNEFLLVAIPLFIMLGEVLLRAGFAERMYGAMSLWLSWLPGGLMHANIGASTLFSATSGSSVATAATVGTVAIPQIRKYGYNEPLFLGSLAAGGTLGILIPPSINLVHLWRADEFVGAQAVPGRHHPRLCDGGFVHADGRDRLRGQTLVGRQEDPCDLGSTICQPGASGAAHGHLLPGGGAPFTRGLRHPPRPPRWACWAPSSLRHGSAG